MTKPRGPFAEERAEQGGAHTDRGLHLRGTGLGFLAGHGFARADHLVGGGAQFRFEFLPHQAHGLIAFFAGCLLQTQAEFRIGFERRTGDFSLAKHGDFQVLAQLTTPLNLPSLVLRRLPGGGRRVDEYRAPVRHGRMRLMGRAGHACMLPSRLSIGTERNTD